MQILIKDENCVGPGQGKGIYFHPSVPLHGNRLKGMWTSDRKHRKVSRHRFVFAEPPFIVLHGHIPQGANMAAV